MQHYNPHTSGRQVTTYAFEDGRPRPSAMIGERYEVLRTLGKGAFGIVRLCHDHERQRSVALKTFHQEHLSDRGTRELFLREGGIWIHLGSHPNIVQAYEINAFDHGLSVYIVLEPISPPVGRKAPALDQWVAEGPLPVEASLRLGIDIVRGMRHATERIPGLIHCDLKPQNILVGSDGRARVSDFGLAAALNRYNGATDWVAASPHGGGGTLLYMAPEQRAGMALDQRADIFAFGCILYEMLLGSDAVNLEGCRTREEMIQRDREGRLRMIPDTLSGPLRDLLARCLASDRNERTASWHALERKLCALYVHLVGQEAPALVQQSSVLATEAEKAGSFLNLSRGYYDIGKLDQAGQLAEQALRCARAAQHPLYETQAVEVTAKIAAARGDFESAWAHYNEAFVLAQHYQQRDVQSAIANSIGLMLIDRGNLEAAQSWLQEALDLAQQRGDAHNAVTIQSNLGLILHRQGQSEQSLALFKRLLDTSVGRRHQQGVLSALMNIAYVLNELGDQESAIPLFHHGLEVAEQIGSLERQCEIMGNLGFAYYFSEDYTQGRDAFQSQLEMAREMGDLEEEQRAWSGLGSCLLGSGDAQAAMKIATERIHHARAAGDKNAEGAHRRLLAQALHKLSNLAAAIEQLALAAHLFREAGNQPEQRVAQALAERFQEELLNTTDVREQNLQLASTSDQRLATIRVRKGAQEIAEALRDSGNLYLLAEHYQTARGRLEEGLLVVQRAHLHKVEITILDLLVVVCGHLKEWEDMREYGERLFVVARNFHNPEEFLPLFENLALAYQRLDRWQDAADTLKQALQVAYKHSMPSSYLHLACRLANLHLEQKAISLATESVQFATRVGCEVGPTAEVALLNLRCGKLIMANYQRVDAIPYVDAAAQLYETLDNGEAAMAARHLSVALRFPIQAII